jgi:hypothetical protein
MDCKSSAGSRQDTTGLSYRCEMDFDKSFRGSFRDLIDCATKDVPRTVLVALTRFKEKTWFCRHTLYVDDSATTNTLRSYGRVRVPIAAEPEFICTYPCRGPGHVGGPATPVLPSRRPAGSGSGYPMGRNSIWPCPASVPVADIGRIAELSIFSILLFK